MFRPSWQIVANSMTLAQGRGGVLLNSLYILGEWISISFFLVETRLRLYAPKRKNVVGRAVPRTDQLRLGSSVLLSKSATSDDACSTDSLEK